MVWTVCILKIRRWEWIYTIERKKSCYGGTMLDHGGRKSLPSSMVGPSPFSTSKGHYGSQQSTWPWEHRDQQPRSHWSLSASLNIQEWWSTGSVLSQYCARTLSPLSWRSSWSYHTETNTQTGPGLEGKITPVWCQVGSIFMIVNTGEQDRDCDSIRSFKNVLWKFLARVSMYIVCKMYILFASEICLLSTLGLHTCTLNILRNKNALPQVQVPGDVQLITQLFF